MPKIYPVYLIDILLNVCTGEIGKVKFCGNAYPFKRCASARFRVNKNQFDVAKGIISAID